MRGAAGTGDVMGEAEEARMALRFQTGDWETGTITRNGSQEADSEEREEGCFKTC